ncbi:unnamed protein product, partial [Chrysoparadoxa australica]
MQLFGAKTTYIASVASASCVEVALFEGCFLLEKLLNLAAGNGNLEVCMKLKSLNCPWDRWGSTCAVATKGGHLELLKWPSEGPDPCPWDRCVCYLGRGHLELFKWEDLCAALASRIEPISLCSLFFPVVRVHDMLPTPCCVERTHWQQGS